jgi:hypothetical protein
MNFKIQKISLELGTRKIKSALLERNNIAIGAKC